MNYSSSFYCPLVKQKVAQCLLSNVIEPHEFRNSKAIRVLSCRYLIFLLQRNLRKNVSADVDCYSLFPSKIAQICACKPSVSPLKQWSFFRSRINIPGPLLSIWENFSARYEEIFRREKTGMVRDGEDTSVLCPWMPKNKKQLEPWPHPPSG